MKEFSNKVPVILDIEKIIFETIFRLAQSEGGDSMSILHGMYQRIGEYLEEHRDECEVWKKWFIGESLLGLIYH